ncbi:DnaB-like helicase C-terminal domain-containing protein [Aurantimonas sp. A2-1-M11]|uniref:DnaB-like helicase C-terminal domain-containing protein n=1 Tax=Aurantimonas sp. A2-1-M11 TaxID=3113712 RepID=UPI002F928B53
MLIESFDDASLKEIGATVASLKKRIGLKLAIVDHAKMITLPGRPGDMFAERVNGLYRGLKAIAKKHGVAIVILIQRNNDWKGRKNPRPIHSDAYGGGGVKQNLDAFFSLYRPESLYTDMRDIEPKADEKARLTGLIDETRGKAWVINHKRRRGTPNLSRMVKFEPEFTLFSSFARRDDDMGEERP